MSHPDPNTPPGLRPIQIGEVWENPITRERGSILELPHQNLERRAVAEVVARAGAKVVGEHRHPGILERFSVLEGELTVKRSGETSILRQGESVTIEPDVWHDWWNAGDRDGRVRVEVTPGDRFAHMIETFFGLARLGHMDGSGIPNLLQIALCAREFSDVTFSDRRRCWCKAYSLVPSPRSLASGAIAPPIRSFPAQCWRRERNTHTIWRRLGTSRTRPTA